LAIIIAYASIFGKEFHVHFIGFDVLYR
jgi:hypothetical protein